MDSQEQQQTQTVSVHNPYLLRLKCFLCKAPNPNINDENNNLKKDDNTNEKPFNPISKLPLYTCPDCEAKIRLDDKETGSTSTVTSQEFEEESDRMIIVPDTSSEENDDDDDECWCQSCTNDEHDSNARQLWDDLSHIIKCVYRTTEKQFSENQFSDDISKAKEYVKKLTDINPQSLFNKLESIVLEYVREIRSQVFERFHTCSKTSHDVQLFISFLLDEYQMFIQAATNVTIIISYLEENYIKSFHFTWLLYNKHLYEKWIYMDRKIQHSMSTMIDLLQPSNEDENDYSPAEYTQLLNRFLAFDEEMSEIACLYKDSQAKVISQPFQLCAHNGGYQFDHPNPKPTKKKKKTKKIKKSKKSAQETPSTAAVDISSTSVSAQQGSNGSSIGSGNGGDESSSVSSFDDYLLDNDTSSSGYTREEQEELARFILEDDLNEHLNQQLLKGILESVSPFARIQNQMNLEEGEKWIGGILQGIQSETMTTDQVNHSNTEEEATTTAPAAAANLPESSSKKSSSSKSKSNKSSNRRKETSAHPATATTSSSSSQIPKKSIPADLFLPRSIADLSAKIQSVSFTAGTFGSITSTNPNESSSSSSSSSNCSTTTLTAAKTTTPTGQTRLSINLTRKPGSKTEHGGQKIAEALFNELTSLGNGECLNNGRKKENQQFKKTKQQQQQQRSTINETLLNSSTNPHSFFNPSNKPDSNSSSSNAYNNLDQLLRHAASNTDVSEAALNSILSSFHSPTYQESPSKTTEKLQALLAQQQHYHHHQQQHKKNLSNHTNTNKHCEFCCCEFAEGRTCSASACLHLSSNTTNGPMTSCVTCMALPGTSSTTTSVMGTAITGAFNQRDVEMKERLKLKLNKRNVQNSNEQQTSNKDQEKKTSLINKKPSTVKTNSKTKDVLMNDKNDIDDLVRFIDGNESVSSNHHEYQPSTTNSNESTSKKNRKKKEKQAKANHNNEETKTNAVQSKEQQQQKKQNGSNNNQQTSSQQPSRSASSSSSSTKVTSVPVVETQQQQQQPPLSKRKQKAKLKLEQKQQQEREINNDLEESATTTAPVKRKNSPPVFSAPVTVPRPVPLASSTSNSSSQGTNATRTSIDIPSENFDSPEEEVNWITISRKQGKHKPTPPSVPSLLAAPIPPVVPPTNTKQHRQQQGTTNTKKTTNNSSLAQQKVIPSNVATSETIATNKQQQHATAAPPRLQNALKNHASHQSQKVDLAVSSQPSLQSSSSSNLWTNNHIHEYTPVIPPSYIPTHTPTPSPLVTPAPIGGVPTMPSSSIYWDPNGYLLSSPSTSSSSSSQSTIPGPVQRPTPSFSPAPGTMNNTTTSRCIQRPSPEPRAYSTTSAPFPLYSPMNYAAANSTSTWNDTSGTNTHDSQWNYPQEQPIGSSTTTATTTDFPLYDPFHSGAGLTIPSTTQTPLLTNGYSEHFEALSHDNDINEMDALDKEIEDFKKFCFETVPLETREKVQVNADRRFIRQT